MSLFLGFDTSNYTTSVALYDSALGQVTHVKKLLPVKEGQLGLRQSDAVFHHVRQLPELAHSVLGEYAGKIVGVGVSTRPRDVEGSYMPCFLVGQCVAEIISDALRVPLFSFSHQAGHIAAALYSANALSLLEREFFAFHFSGGTTECVKVSPKEDTVIGEEIFSKTLDISVGQVIDRAGVLLGTPFPAGPYVEGLAKGSTRHFPIRLTFKGVDPCLSGVENQCQKLVKEGCCPADVANFALEYVGAVVERMAADAQAAFSELPLVFAGGVMSNDQIKRRVKQKFPCYFASPQFSADNAAGVAVLAARKAGQ